jgi:hypothetical protein
MRQVLVSVQSGAGVVRAEHGVLVTGDIGEGGGSYLRDDDRFQPVKSWVDQRRSVVGGLLPPGAVSAEAVDDTGNRVVASVAEGAYVAVLEQPNDGHEPVVCCRDENGKTVRRPWAADYPSVRVTDAKEPCPACGAIDWDEYTPFEEWRGGRGSKVDGTHVPNPVVSCRACGHEEHEGTFFGTSSNTDEPEDEETRAARIARARAHQRKQRWLSDTLTLRATNFPIYAADGWPARLGGSGSQADQLTKITVHHYESQDADLFAADRPRLAVTTKNADLNPGNALAEARGMLEDWVRRNAGAARWPEASHAAITLWLRARDRDTRAAVLNAVQSEQLITIDGAPTMMLMLTAPPGRWVAAAGHADLTVIVAAHDIEPGALRLEPIGDPAAQLLGPEPPDA